MRYLSLFSGIEAATVAWHPMGWESVAFSEIEPFPCAVLTHHYPGVPNWGDVTKHKEWPDEPVELVVGGSPCQAFSVAGLRKGLDDPRGNLTLVYLGVVEQYRPRWVVWENVPGVLSIDGGRVFGAFLGALAKLGYGWAYRILDAQYFGVPQRRRRVFVVGHLGDWRRAAQVLFEPACLGWHEEKVRIENERFSSYALSGFGEYVKDRVGTIKKSYSKTDTFVVDTETNSARAFVPTEIERLLGFSDRYTDIPWRGREHAPDGPRYKALGNSMAVPVMKWIGERIQLVENLIAEEKK